MTRGNSCKQDRNGHHSQRVRPAITKARSVSNVSIRSASPVSTVRGAKSRILKRHHSGSSAKDSRKHGKIDRQKCSDLLSEVQTEMEREADEQLARATSRFQAEKAQDVKTMEQIIAEKDSLSAKNIQAEGEVSRLKQELEAQALATQGQLSWSEIQSALYQAHSQLTAAATGFWNSIEAIQNRQLATFLPGSSAMDCNWLDLGGTSNLTGSDTFASLYNSQAAQQDEQAIN
ncbi:hypothetical protein N7478_001379 [Penicillium angulare]|uniref:uncharacterized protein n=1 Tax=Penicillium angulare TaxID=116970 RepID=UPI0025416EB3|nr:uncharacterized protein N7478_001320 [Penicillium angulare]XP_056785474.1 uncharacterized protein N7478_001379 [Penicillium angulare]KAJ5292069.1 hypothetical protein N7478_001320 [Penicillium angulare]KAJ5292128.1 hypothetical protein N7478_001379 [Penicillium angulare]